MKIYNETSNLYLLCKTIKFSGGEVNVKLTTDSGNFEPLNKINSSDKFIITQRICNSDDLMELLLVTNALRQLFVKDIEVVIPYVPYARQDRVMVEGEAMSIKVFSDIINLQNYSKVTIFDPHSSVTPALINNVNIVDNVNFVTLAFNHLLSLDLSKHGLRLVSPDAGALKKVDKCHEELVKCNYVSTDEPIIGAKHRDVSTGKITRTSINVSDVPFNSCVIIDDICDRGRTFIELSKELKAKGAAHTILLVSHGIFPDGFDTVLEEVDYIITTDSFRKFSNEDLEKYKTKVKQINFEACLF